MNAPIGHNNPPAVFTMAAHIEDLFALVSGCVAVEVATDDQEAALDKLLDEVRQAKKDADRLRADEKRPHDDAAKAVQAAWLPLIARCDKAADAIKERLTPYRTARQAAKDTAARIAREQAEAEQAAAQAALRKSDDLETRFAAEEKLERAAKLVAAANRIDRSATGLRTHWEAEVTDRRAALNYYIERSPESFADFIQTLADQDARGARAPVPGVVFHERKRAA